MIVEAIGRLVGRLDLTQDEAREVMGEIMEGKATPAQIASFITTLRMKGETPEEITGCALAMREKSTKIKAKNSMVIDTCGTGGDRTGTFNISTASAFVVAGAGITVAKHGNRSVSSHCGSADVLQALGINIEADVQKVEECLNEIGIAFLFAPLLHSAMKYAIGPRREIGIRTVFNILGPLTNPAGASAQVLGVYAESLTEVIAEVLGKLGLKHSFVVHGDGLDEITTTGSTKITEQINSKIKTYYLKPEDFGLKKAKLEDLKGGTPGENAEILLRILRGGLGPQRDIVLLNAAAAIVAAGKAQGLGQGLGIAAQSIDSGEALRKLELLKERTNYVPPKF